MYQYEVQNKMLTLSKGKYTSTMLAKAYFNKATCRNDVRSWDPKAVADTIFTTKGSHKSIEATRKSLIGCLSNTDGRLVVNLGQDHLPFTACYEASELLIPVTNGFDPKHNTGVYGVMVMDPLNLIETEIPLYRDVGYSYWTILMDLPKNKQDVKGAASYAHGCLKQANDYIQKETNFCKSHPCLVFVQSCKQEANEDAPSPAKKAKTSDKVKQQWVNRIIAVISLSPAPFFNPLDLTLERTFRHAYTAKQTIFVEALSYAVLLGRHGHSVAKKNVQEVLAQLRTCIEDPRLVNAMEAAYQASRETADQFGLTQRSHMLLAGDAILKACFTSEELGSMEEEAKAEVTLWYQKNVVMHFYASVNTYHDEC